MSALPDGANNSGRLLFSTDEFTGPVPDTPEFLRVYRDLSRDGRQIIDRAGSYLPGLYVNAAHGSRGLVYAPLAAEIIASRIAAEAPPVPQVMADALNPARFLIRRLIRS